MIDHHKSQEMFAALFGEAYTHTLSQALLKVYSLAPPFGGKEDYTEKMLAVMFENIHPWGEQPKLEKVLLIDERKWNKQDTAPAGNMCISI